jgi:phosphopantetheinyl transferase (holo-ACP synthase)
VEVVKESSGQPRINLTGESERIARELGIVRWHISISHIETHATASAIGLRAAAPELPPTD